MSRVSVLVPCYNYGRFLDECVGSVLSQRGVEVDVLIIDDASPDGSGETAEELAARHDRVELSRHSINRGHIETYNEGIAWARGDYTLLLSADDVLIPDSLVRATRLLDGHPDVGFVYGRVMSWQDGTPLPPPPQQRAKSRIRDGHEWLENRCRAGGNYCGTPAVLTRTRLQQELGGYRHELPHSGDMEMWLRFAAHAPVGYVHAHQAYARVHNANMSRQYYASMLSDLEQRRAAFDVLFRDQGHVVAEADRLHDLANRSLACDALLHARRDVESGHPDPVKVDEFIDFAMKTWAEAASLPEYGRLQRRLRWGGRISSMIRPVMPLDLARRVQMRARYEYRKRLGG